jgi:hypothetical protein
MPPLIGTFILCSAAANAPRPTSIVTEAHPVAGMIFDVGRAALRKNNSDDE